MPDATSARRIARGAVRRGSLVSSRQLAGAVEADHHVGRHQRGDDEGAEVAQPPAPRRSGAARRSGPRSAWVNSRITSSDDADQLAGDADRVDPRHQPDADRVDRSWSARSGSRRAGPRWSRRRWRPATGRRRRAGSPTRASGARPAARSRRRETVTICAMIIVQPANQPNGRRSRAGATTGRCSPRSDSGRPARRSRAPPCSWPTKTIGQVQKNAAPPKAKPKANSWKTVVRIETKENPAANEA